MQRKEAVFGIGIENVKERLKIYYGSEDCLQIFSKEGEGTLCRITLIPENEKEVEQKCVISQIKYILPDIFGMSGSVLNLKTDGMELLCLIPNGVCTQEVENLIRLIQRRASLYLDVTPVISHAKNQRDPDKIRKAYQNCCKAIQVRFYEPDRTLFAADELPEFEVGSSAYFHKLSQDMGDACARGETKKIAETARGFLDTCRKQALEPKWVTDTCRMVAEETAF